MLLAQARLVEVAPFSDLTFRFTAGDGAPRRMTVIVGGGGVGKTSLLAAVASTRPGHALPQTRPWAKAPASGTPASYTTLEWLLDDDDPARPHTLRVASPNAPQGEREDEVMLRRREQAHFDRRASEGGFTLVAISGARWFSRSPVLLSSPERSVLRYDARASASFDDATRADLARETKQILAYASIGAALAPEGPMATLDRAVRGAVSALVRLADVRYFGADATTLEPMFTSPEGDAIAFDDLPTSVRHLVAFAAIPVRALAAAYPGRNPREAQGVVLLDDVDLHQDASVQRVLPAALREALPRVQWILTTASMPVALGCEASEILALRRMPSSRHVELYEGAHAVVH